MQLLTVKYYEEHRAPCCAPMGKRMGATYTCPILIICFYKDFLDTLRYHGYISSPFMFLDYLLCRYFSAPDYYVLVLCANKLN